MQKSSGKIIELMKNVKVQSVIEKCYQKILSMILIWNKMINREVKNVERRTRNDKKKSGSRGVLQTL